MRKLNSARRLAGTLLIILFCAAATALPGRSAAGPAADLGASLSGKVSSQAEGPMEGVLVGARKAGSTMAVWVGSNAQGQYSFPRGRMEPGTYAISIRAVGYELPNTSVDIAAQPAHLDLQLSKVTGKSKLAMQMSNGELLTSMPGTPEDKEALGNCVNCHTLQRILFSRFDAAQFATVVQRMGTHTNNSSPMHPWTRPSSGPMRPPNERQITQGKYLSTINLSSVDTFEFPLKTLARPKGKATEVIYTTYDLPRPDAAPHDVALDAQGNAWYSDFTAQYFGKLDTKTGKVTDYQVPLYRKGPYAQGGLQIALDREGRVYYGNMSQMQVIRFDPKTEKMETFRPPIPEPEIAPAAHLTMIDSSFEQVDGKIWVNVVGNGGEGAESDVSARDAGAGGTWQVDLSTNTWTKVTYPPGSPPAGAYDVVADSMNNMFGMQFRNEKLWITDGKTLKTAWYDLPDKDKGCRRGHRDSQDRLWCGGFNSNDIVMFDPKTKQMKAWKAPTEWSRPYDAEFDDQTYAWGAGMDNDLALRLNSKTGEITEYLLPHETNVRHVEVQKTGSLSSLWLGDQHSNLIIHVEPLTP